MKNGGSLNITCVAVGSPMPFVKWRQVGNGGDKDKDNYKKNNDKDNNKKYKDI